MVELGTAESETKLVPTLEDIEAEELVYRFDSIVKISQDEPLENTETDNIERKLNYDTISPKKLSFAPKSSSMKKKKLPEEA